MKRINFVVLAAMVAIIGCRYADGVVPVTSMEIQIIGLCIVVPILMSVVSFLVYWLRKEEDNKLVRNSNLCPVYKQAIKRGVIK